MECPADENLYHDHLNKCRCCFREPFQFSSQSLIQEWQREIFHALTNIELRNELGLSTNICMECITMFSTIDKFRVNVGRLQDGYYDFMIRYNDDINNATLQKETENHGNSAAKQQRIIECAVVIASQSLNFIKLEEPADPAKVDDDPGLDLDLKNETLDDRMLDVAEHDLSNEDIVNHIPPSMEYSWMECSVQLKRLDPQVIDDNLCSPDDAVTVSLVSTADSRT